jgi:hypothetical protein
MFLSSHPLYTVNFLISVHNLLIFPEIGKSSEAYCVGVVVCIVRGTYRVMFYNLDVSLQLLLLFAFLLSLLIFPSFFAAAYVIICML